MTNHDFARFSLGKIQAMMKTCSRCLSTTAATGSFLVFIIEDDGPGFDAEADRERPQQERRSAVLGMEERASRVGGKLTVESEIGAGANAVFVRLPCDALRLGPYGAAGLARH